MPVSPRLRCWQDLSLLVTAGMAVMAGELAATRFGRGFTLHEASLLIAVPVVVVGLVRFRIRNAAVLAAAAVGVFCLGAYGADYLVGLLVPVLFPFIFVACAATAAALVTALFLCVRVNVSLLSAVVLGLAGGFGGVLLTLPRSDSPMAGFTAIVYTNALIVVWAASLFAFAVFQWWASRPRRPASAAPRF